MCTDCDIQWGNQEEAIELLKSWYNEEADKDDVSWETLRLALLESDPDIGL